MNPPDNLKPTPFLPFYRDGVLDWIDVLGFAMPATWGDVPGEYGAIRNAVAAIEFSVLLKYDVKGPGAVATVDAVFSRDVAGMAAGKIAYGVIVTDEGYMIDDCTVFVHGPEHVQVIGGSEHIGASLHRAARPGTVIAERRDELAQLAVQGPNSRALLQRLTAADLSSKALPYYNFITGVEVAGIAAQVSRLGFTGELGYEVIIPVDRAADLWAALTKEGRDLGFRAAGGAALMTARMEAGLLMSGLDYGPDTTPWECRMGWALALEKAEFQGKDALIALKDKVRTRVVTIVLDPTDVDLEGATLQLDGRPVGTIIMALPSPDLDGKIISMVTVDVDASRTGTKLAVAEHPGLVADVVSTPVYDPERSRARS